MSNDFTMFAGDSKRLQVTVVDDTGAVVDISGFPDIRWQMSRAVSRPALLEKALGAGIEIISGPAGRFDVMIDEPDTELLRQGSYYHEAEVINVDSLVATVLSGSVTILPTLIKPEVSP